MIHHRGIRIDRIPVKGLPGLIFTIAILTLGLGGIPETRLFLAINVIGGLILSAGLYWWRHQTRW